MYQTVDVEPKWDNCTDHNGSKLAELIKIFWLELRLNISALGNVDSPDEIF